MTMQHGAGPTAGIVQVAAALHPAERVASSQACRPAVRPAKPPPPSRLTRSRAGFGCAGGTVTG
jgi:hypothetical protein